MLNLDRCVIQQNSSSADATSTILNETLSRVVKEKEVYYTFGCVYLLFLLTFRFCRRTTRICW